MEKSWGQWPLGPLAPRIHRISLNFLRRAWARLDVVAVNSCISCNHSNFFLGEILIKRKMRSFWVSHLNMLPLLSQSFEILEFYNVHSIYITVSGFLHFD